MDPFAVCQALCIPGETWLNAALHCTIPTQDASSFQFNLSCWSLLPLAWLRSPLQDAAETGHSHRQRRGHWWRDIRKTMDFMELCVLLVSHTEHQAPRGKGVSARRWHRSSLAAAGQNLKGKKERREREKKKRDWRRALLLTETSWHSRSCISVPLQFTRQLSLQVVTDAPMGKPLTVNTVGEKHKSLWLESHSESLLHIY